MKLSKVNPETIKEEVHKESTNDIKEFLRMHKKQLKEAKISEDPESGPVI